VLIDQQSEIAALLALSARLGRNPLLVQASSGNTSIKLSGVLWIKASGKWLARAGEEDMLVPVSLAAVRESVQRDEEVSAAGASIETAMHAVLRHQVVVHVHSVNTISWAVRQDGAARVAERLAGLNWSWIPYAGSGLPLAREIRAVTTRSPQTNIFVLANHGLVVCGESCHAVEDLLEVVEERLAVDPRKEIDPVVARILSGGILCPCQMMLTAPRYEEMTDCQRAIWIGLLQVARRLDESAPIRYLSNAEINDLLDNDIHGYLASAERNAVPVPGAVPTIEAVPLAALAVAHAGR